MLEANQLYKFTAILDNFQQTWYLQFEFSLINGMRLVQTAMQCIIFSNCRINNRNLAIPSHISHNNNTTHIATVFQKCSCPFAFMLAYHNSFDILCFFGGGPFPDYHAGYPISEMSSHLLHMQMANRFIYTETVDRTAGQLSFANFPTVELCIPRIPFKCKSPN